MVLFRLFVKSSYGAYELAMSMERKSATKLLKDARRAARSKNVTLAKLSAVQVNVIDCRRWALKLYNSVKEWYETPAEAEVGRKIYKAAGFKIRLALGIIAGRSRQVWRESRAAWWTRFQEGKRSNGGDATTPKSDCGDSTSAAVGAWRPFNASAPSFPDPGARMSEEEVWSAMMTDEAELMMMKDKRV